MKENKTKEPEKLNEEEYECYRCHHKLTEARALPFAGRIICPRCLRNLLAPILIILTAIILVILVLALV
ncbi:MAG: hypothetical protein BAJALOKI3v1_940016 [Promethearchaeota archaeon]|jgi:hypothetical protein|nr:MAG: hypothetical protein BAJALOKI3v1_940016 [Candidatus Lokiarchaeota archaeon]